MYPDILLNSALRCFTEGSYAVRMRAELVDVMDQVDLFPAAVQKVSR